MSRPDEFHYRLPQRVGGYRPGYHKGLSVGAGQDFAAHARLFDNPDPRRLDLRASLRDPRRDWLVRTFQQRAALSVNAVVDVSASMHFGGRETKLGVAADFVESMGHSAYRVGDASGMSTFDCGEPSRLYSPARRNRGAGIYMANLLRCRAARGPAAPKKAEASDYARALGRAVQHLAGKNALVFLVSDFHWPLSQLEAALETLDRASVIPIVVWDSAEVEPPDTDGLLTARDAESGSHRPVWINERIRNQWRERVAERRRQIDATFEPTGITPF